MSSTSTTRYYGLTQYVGTDKPSFLDNNEAFAAVDADLHGAVTDVASQGETITSLSETVGTLGETVTGLGNDLNTEKGKIVALQNKEELQDAAIAGVKTAALDMICAYTEASATSTHAYAIGDYFRYQDVLYQATSAIAIGDTIVPNVNCSATNVTEELDKVMAAIPTTAADVPLAAITGMTADDVQEGIAELKSVLTPINGTYGGTFHDLGAGSRLVITLPPSYIASYDITLGQQVEVVGLTYYNAISISSSTTNEIYINYDQADASHIGKLGKVGLTFTPKA